MKKKEKDHEERNEEKKKEKKIKEKKKKKDDEKEKKKKKKKEKKSGQKDAIKDESIKSVEQEELIVETKQETMSPTKADVIKSTNEDENIENRIVCIPPEPSMEESIKEEFEDKSLAMNPEPPEFHEPSPERIDHTEFGTNPPNPNFKPIPELKSEIKPIDNLYSGLDDTEINTVITEKYSLLSENETEEKSALLGEKSPKKDEFLAPLPELSKWERDDTVEKGDEICDSSIEKIQTDEPKSTKVVTSEVLKRAENAIFQKAINAIRPIEIKKISESRKVLYQNPEPKVIETEPNREPRKSVNVTINVGRNERNVEITEPVKKAKLDRTKFKPVPETYSPTRLSAKERLGEKVEENKERKISPIKSFLDRREGKSENQSRSRSPRIRDKRISPLLDRRVDSSLNLPGNERKVFLDDRKRENKDRSKDRSDFRNERHDMRSSDRDPRGDFRSTRNDAKDKDRDKERDRERRGRTPSCTFKRNDISKMSLLKGRDDENDRRREKKSKEDKKRKKDHRSRSKSKEHKKRKEKKHKKDKEKNSEKKQKHKENIVLKDKVETSETKINYENPEPPVVESIKKQRKNPRLVSDRKRSILDEANFEPDYSASDSESDGEDGKVMPLPAKKLKLDEPDMEKEMDIKPLKKRSKSTSSEDSSSSSDSSSTDSDSSDESHKKKKKKHKKHKKKKSIKKDSSSDTDSYSDSSETSSDEEKHKKKSKKSKNRNKQAKKKKKSKHK